MFASMAGIYVHIPFCRKACHYCNFHFTTSFNKKDELVTAILEEIKIQAHYLNGQWIGTIYFGGGTPSALPPADLEKILAELKIHHSLMSEIEITLEANPDDISIENLLAWKKMGINRLSIGIQAFQDDLLRGWNRNHSAQQGLSSIALVYSVGFHNISADLIYGGQGLSDEDWISNIYTLIKYDVPHISSYALTVEKGTVLDHDIRKGKVKEPDDEQSNRQYSILQSLLREAGYDQYEISNFAKPGFRSIHNTSYWSGILYLGIGPSAHSFDGVSRQWNVATNIKYTHSLRHGKVPSEKEVLTDVQRYNELVMTGLRTSGGINMNKIMKLGESFSQYLSQQIQIYAERKVFPDDEGVNYPVPVQSADRVGEIFIMEDGHVALRPEYYFFADGIAAELFMIVEK